MALNNRPMKSKKDRVNIHQQQAQRVRAAKIAADPYVPPEKKIEAVLNTDSTFGKKAASQPPKVSDRVWNIAGEFIEYAREHKKDLGLDKEELRMRQDNLAAAISDFLNSDEPTEFLASLRVKFPKRRHYLDALDWMLHKSIEVYWERWSEDEKGYHQVRFVEYLDGLLRRTYDLYQHHLWNLQGRPEMPRTVQGGTMADLAEIDRQDGERRLISHFGGHYPGYGVQVEDDLLLALPGPTNKGEDAQ